MFDISVEFQSEMAWHGTIPFGEEDIHYHQRRKTNHYNLAGSFVFDSALGFR
jgi:hypothetical protein